MNDCARGGGLGERLVAVRKEDELEALSQTLRDEFAENLFAVGLDFLQRRSGAVQPDLL